MAAPWIDIELDELRKIRFQHNDAADIEVYAGKGIGELLEKTQFHGARVLLAYGLRWRDHKITPKTAGDLIQKYWIEKGKTLDELADVLMEALIAGGIAQRPKAAEGAEGNAPPEAATT
jgi:hypothetical protein